MLAEVFPAGPWATNCYIVAPGPGEPCIVIDPGYGVGPWLAEKVRDLGLRPVAVLLTHGHIDHIWSVAPVAKGFGIPSLVQAQDRYRLVDPAGSTAMASREQLLAMTQGALELTEPDEVRTFEDGAELDLAGLTFAVQHAPGHTEGSAVFTVSTEARPVMWSGDVLFAGSIGRTDLPGGDPVAMARSLAQVILPAADDTQVLPGHGEATTIGREKATNPFLRHLAQRGS